MKKILIIEEDTSLQPWNSKKKGKGMELKITPWGKCPQKNKLKELGEAYADFRQQPLSKLEI